MAARRQMASPVRDQENEAPLGETAWAESAACKRKILHLALYTTPHQPRGT